MFKMSDIVDGGTVNSSGGGPIPRRPAMNCDTESQAVLWLIEWMFVVELAETIQQCPGGSQRIAYLLGLATFVEYDESSIASPIPDPALVRCRNTFDMMFEVAQDTIDCR